MVNFIRQPPDEGYKIARMLLQKRYGDTHKRLGSYRQEIKEWSQLRMEDARAFKEFSNFLRKCQNVTRRNK